MKKIFSTVTNDIVTDQRVLRIAHALADAGFSLRIIGRKLKESEPLIDESIKFKRFNLLINKGFLFYGEYNFRLFLYLVVKQPQIVLANDVDTLLGCYIYAKIFKRKLIFDSHELFSEIPELVNRKRVKKIWRAFENKIIPKVEFGITVCDSIARIYKEKYEKQFLVIRNIPVSHSLSPESTNKIQGNYILYQGFLNIGRGIELMIKATNFFPLDLKLVVAGAGDIDIQLRELTEQLKLTDKVIFTGRLLPDDLQVYTKNAKLGLSLEENLGLNYYYALPNKLFSYIQAEIPVLVSDLPEMSNIVENYKVGKVFGRNTAEELADEIIQMIENKEEYARYKNNLKLASKELTWENEKKKLDALIKEIS